MPKILTLDGFTVHVYAEHGSQHNLPHCHVRTSEADTVVAIPTLDVLVGPSLPRWVRDSLAESVNELVRVWEILNSPREGEDA